MSIARTTCSQPSVSRSNPAGEASGGHQVSRSESEPGSASIRQLSVASRPKQMKPAIGGEETSLSTRRTLRGERGQRGWKDRSRNLADPPEWGQRPQRRQGRHNVAVGSVQESDRPIGAGKRVTTVEPRGLTRNVFL